MDRSLTALLEAVVATFSTPCYNLLPSILQPFFTSQAFIPNSSSQSIPLYGALTPPVTYFLALFLLSSPNPSLSTATFKNILAVISAITFFLLPFRYHVPGSAILTYQLGLIGCFGAGRVVDIFLLSRPQIPRRIKIPQPGRVLNGTVQGYLRKPELGEEDSLKDQRDGRVYPHTDNMSWEVLPTPVTLWGRLWWALDLMISMRGVGWQHATSDVRHDISPWQPPSRRQLKRAVLKILPAFAASVVVLRRIVDAQVLYTVTGERKSHNSQGAMQSELSIANLPPALRPVMVLATGVALYTLFDGGYTIASALLLPLMRSYADYTDVSLHNVDFFPLLNPLKLTEVCSVRSFWSKAWHRLFSRVFVVFGSMPLQNLAVLVFPTDDATFLSLKSHPDPGRLMPKGQYDAAKVIGAFTASAVIHAISERAALGGRLALPSNNLWLQAGWGPRPHNGSSLLFLSDTTQDESLRGKYSVTRMVPPFSGGGELTFFVLNGLAVIVEGGFHLWIRKQRKGRVVKERKDALDAQLRAVQKEGVVEQARKASSSALLSSAIQSTSHRSVAANGRVEAVDDDESDATATPSGGAIKRPGSPSFPCSDADSLPHLDVAESELVRWYDRSVGLIWTVVVLLWTGEAFIEGWIKSGIMAELTLSPH